MSKCPGAGPFRHDTPRFGEFKLEFASFHWRPKRPNSCVIRGHQWGGSPGGSTSSSPPLDPLRCPSVRVLVHSGTIRLDSASSNWNSRRFTGDQSDPTRVSYAATNGGGPLGGRPVRAPPLTPSDVQVSGCWSIPARYASIRRVQTGIRVVSLATK